MLPNLGSLLKPETDMGIIDIAKHGMSTVGNITSLDTSKVTHCWFDIRFCLQLKDSLISSADPYCLPSTVLDRNKFGELMLPHEEGKCFLWCT